MSTSHAWTPPPAVVTAGNLARVAHAYAPETGPGEQREPLPALMALRDALVPIWPGVTSGGMRRDTARIWTVSRDPHKAGLAIDFMVSFGTLRNLHGDALANFLAFNAERLGLQYVLWRRVELSMSPYGPRWENYTGTDPHDDHVHVELSPAARGWSYAEMTARVHAALRDAQPRHNAPKVAAAVAGGLGAAGLIALIVRAIGRR